MADLSVTADKVSRAFPEKDFVFDFVAAEAINAGQPVYINSAGKVAKASAAAAGTARVVGIALNKAGAGQAVSVLNRGHLEGFSVSGLAYDAQVFLSNTAGSLADAAGTVSKVVGRVVPIADKSLTKLIYIDCDNR